MDGWMDWAGLRCERLVEEEGGREEGRYMWMRGTWKRKRKREGTCG